MKRYRILLVFAFAILNAAFGRVQVTSQRLVKAAKEPQNWLTYSGDYAGWRHSALKQIHTANVGHLAAQWVFQSEAKGKFETTPLVFDGVMYVTGNENLAYALDARTGRMIWRYRHPLPDRLPDCCGKVNRGFAVLGDKVFLATLDAHLVALDTKTGNVIWDVVAADYRKGYSFTLAPWPSKTKSSWGRREASTGSADSSMPMTRKRAREPGASTPSPGRTFLARSAKETTSIPIVWSRSMPTRES